MSNISGQKNAYEKVKYNNAALVYQLIDLNGPISRVNIVQKSDLAPASVTNLTRQLMKHNLVSELSQEASTGGRPAIALTTNQKDFYFVSCRLGRTDIHSSLMDLAGNIIFHHITPILSHDAGNIVATLKQEISQCLSCSNQKNLIAISVTMAGLVDTNTGLVNYSPNHQIGGLNLISSLNHFGLPVFIGNDIRALALAEYYLGHARQCDDFILVTIHGGIGAGIVSNGNLLSGKQRTVGEIGHVQIDPFGEQCHCGNFGCLETLVSNDAIVSRTSQLIKRGHPTILSNQTLSVETICQAAESGDEVAIHIVEETARYLGQVLSTLVNLFNPEKVLLAGEIIQNSKKILFPVLQTQIERQALNKFNKEMHLCMAKYQKQGTMGGYALVKRAMHNGELLSKILETQS
ncbi:ROK family protein [Vibrio salinus]|uniref:ROK family protein n=1 Tax=Vibrio salinus TaxID=2899784 RepID=UPI001E549488|nr:ROK family protein [Vibrio salinus]MCE0492592.1 ROK family protein [Vibrio salinus]